MFQPLNKDILCKASSITKTGKAQRAVIGAFHGDPRAVKRLEEDSTTRQLIIQLLKACQSSSVTFSL